VRLGLIGAGIQASRSPAMHLAEAAAHGLEAEYRLIDLDVLGVGAEALPSLLAGAEAEGFDGLNITHPCKQAVLPLLDDIADDARAVGAVNTVVLRGGRRSGHNTDWWAFRESLRDGLPNAELERVAQFGAGGAGAATAYAVLALGAGQVRVVDVDRERAAALVAAMIRAFGHGRAISVDPHTALDDADGVIQATPIGMASHPGSPFDPSRLRAKQWVAEVIYFPRETALLRAARERGCATLDGSGMAVFQAARAFELFTGLAASPLRMRKAFDGPEPGARSP
jgi:shikimate dehydrogenase